MSLFQQKQFTLHSGSTSFFKIECDALTKEDWETLALIVAKTFSFKKVEGVPRGGIKFAKALEKYADPDGVVDLIIVDDVLTTGNSMNEHRNGREASGFVVFSRTANFPTWIQPLFIMGI